MNGSAHSADLVSMWCFSILKINKYIHIYVYVYMYIIIYVYMYICIYVYMYICIYVYMYICIYVYMYICICIYIYISLGIQSPCQMMIGVYNHLLSKVFRFHYHSQKVIGSLGYIYIYGHPPNPPICTLLVFPYVFTVFCACFGEVCPGLTGISQVRPREVSPRLPWDIPGISTVSKSPHTSKNNKFGEIPICLFVHKNQGE